MKWTKVEDGLPEEDSYVLGWRPSECADFCTFFFHENIGWMELDEEDMLFSCAPPTHWAYIEEPEEL